MSRFDPKDHLMQIKNRGGSSDYLPVQWRLVWFRNECPDGTIETELVHLDLDKEVEEEAYVWNPEKRRSEKVLKTARGVAVFRATVKDGKGGIATGTKMEKAASFPDYLEKAETGSIGRALAALGYGTQFAPELNEEHRIVDSPVETNVHRAELTPQQVKMKALLEEFYQLAPSTYARIPDWETLALRKALDLAENEPIPTDYTDDDIYRMELYITSKKRARAS